MDQQHSEAMSVPERVPNDRLMAYGAILVAIAAIVASFFVIREARANADYICTYVIEENSDCANGSWGPWETISATSDTASCAVTKVERRIYTGTRTVRHILQYLNLRTACESGYLQAGRGDGGTGASGFHGGNIFSQSSACQIEETRTSRNPGTGPQCATTVTQTVTNTGEIIDDTTEISTIDELTRFRASMIAANIYVKPMMVISGATTVVKWQGREVTSCSVAGSNGDGIATDGNVGWTGTAGEQTSGPITEATTYVLTCTAFNGETVTDRATVIIAPRFEEN